MLALLEHEESCALSHHEAVTAPVEWPARRFRRLVLFGHDAEQREELHLDRRHDAFRAAGERHVDRAALDRPQRLADRLRRRRARRLDRPGGPFGAEESCQPRRQILRQRALEAIGADAPRELPRKTRWRDRAVGAATRVRHFAHLPQIDAFATRADEHARAPAAHGIGGICFRDGAARRAHADHDSARLECIEVTLLPERLQHVRVSQCGGDLRRETVRIEVRDAPHAGRTRERRLPERLEAHADRRDHIHARDDDAPSGHHPLTREANIRHRRR